MRKLKQNLGKKKIILGLTGGFGSGKTTVAEILESYGAKIIDADKIAHRFLKTDSPVYKRIIAAFGKGVLNKNRGIDRKRLAALAFGNKNLLRRLNSIIHPPVIRIIKEEISKAKAKVVVLDAPLLIEAGLNKIVDKLIVIKINRIEQIKRIQARRSLSKQEILQRIRSQIPLYRKERLADFVIDNSGTIEETRRQTGKVWRSLIP
jgi:dephospho-CoA kinase